MSDGFAGGPVRTGFGFATYGSRSSGRDWPACDQVPANFLLLGVVLALVVAADLADVERQRRVREGNRVHRDSLDALVDAVQGGRQLAAVALHVQDQTQLGVARVERAGPVSGDGLGGPVSPADAAKNSAQARTIMVPPL